MLSLYWLTPVPVFQLKVVEAAAKALPATGLVICALTGAIVAVV